MSSLPAIVQMPLYLLFGLLTTWHISGVSSSFIAVGVVVPSHSYQSLSLQQNHAAKKGIQLVLNARRSRSKQSFNPRNIESFQPSIESRDSKDDEEEPPKSRSKQKKLVPIQKNNRSIAITNNNNNNNTTIDTSLVTTISGGAQVMFQMARRMLIWQQQEDMATSSTTNTRLPPPLPRWHPYSGVSDDENLQFRHRPPRMDTSGYAASIWRNVRKRSKPSLWRHALRTYHEMNKTSSSSTTTIHHEGALLACAKLGLWQEALSIYSTILAEATTTTLLPPQKQQSSKKIISKERTVSSATITDNMIFSVIKACVRAKTRAPLDAARDILSSIDTKHNIPLTARHVNPLAAAYLKLGLGKESKQVLNLLFAATATTVNDEPSTATVNVFDIGAKDKASYALLVQSAISNNEWDDAVKALEEMTNVQLYPSQRHLNAWHEVVDNRNNKGWKQKRDEYWLDSV